MEETFNSSFYDIGVASMGLKDVFNVAELYVVASRCHDSMQ